ncbi:MAG: endolytic transglycosylase MltG [Bacteroidales bacterium]|nr:endolytic transglycosylase MltG [Bacteroidales bacterium]MDD4671028.1 endolytic transglycosylase MltG [Bacteroidales bacterium]
MKPKKIILSLTALLVIIAAIFAYQYYSVFYKPNVKSDGAILKIYNDMDYNTVMEEVIGQSGSLNNFSRFAIAAKAMKLESSFKPGMYKLRKGMNNKAIVRTIANGWQTPTKLILPGHLNSSEKLASFLGNKLEADSAEFIAFLNNSDLKASYGFNDFTFLGMFIPNTYEVYWTISPTDFLDRMKKEYDNFWNKERTEKAENIGLTKDQVSTLASIVIEESKYVPEQPRIAGVYMNRLKKGMPLQADPTVKYAQNDPTLRRIFKSHLTVDSPYNTYKHTGLPPGPITISPINALDAVLNYEHHNYLYFCARDTFDGQHSFATSYSQHLKNARAYQKAFTERERLKTN